LYRASHRPHQPQRAGAAARICEGSIDPYLARSALAPGLCSKADFVICWRLVFPVFPIGARMTANSRPQEAEANFSTLGAGTVGEILRRQRQAHGISVDEIATILRIRPA